MMNWSSEGLKSNLLIDRQQKIGKTDSQHRIVRQYFTINNEKFEKLPI